MEHVFRLWTKEELYPQAIQRTCLLLDLIESCERREELSKKMAALVDDYNQNIMNCQNDLLTYDEYFDIVVSITGDMIWGVLHPTIDLMVNGVRQN